MPCKRHFSHTKGKPSGVKSGRFSDAVGVFIGVETLFLRCQMNKKDCISENNKEKSRNPKISAFSFGSG
jgi:hypothetical protein